MQRFLTGVCAAAVAACVAIPGLAAEEKKPPEGEAKKRNPEQVFKRLDTNGDKKLSLAEFQGKREGDQIKKQFEAKDTDKDGSLTFAEYSAQPAAKTAPEQKKRSPEDVFKRLDKDSNGKVSFDEFKGKKDETKARAAFDKKDKDKDGNLTLEEFKAQPKKKKNA